MRTKIVVFFNCLLLIGCLSFHDDWTVDLKKCLASSNFTTIFFIIDKSFKTSRNCGHRVHKDIVDLTKDLPIVFTDTIGMYDLEKYAKNYVHTSTLFVPLLAINNDHNDKYVLNGMTKIYTNFLLPRKSLKFFYLLFNFGKKSSDVVKKNLIWIRKFLIDSQIKVLEVFENGLALFHNYDPVTKKYTTDYNCNGEVLFSNVKNLNGRVLRMSIKPDPPDLNVSSRSLSGPQGLILKTIAEASNFTWRIVVERKTIVLNRLTKSLAGRRIDAIGNFLLLPQDTRHEDNETIENLQRLHYSYVRRSRVIVAVVPIIVDSDIPRTNIIDTKNALVLFVFVAIAISILIKFMYYCARYSLNSNNQKSKNLWISIFVIVMTNHRTGYFTYKVFLTIVSFVSIVLFAKIVQQNWKTKLNYEDKIKINTLDELEESGLRFMISEDYRDALLESNDQRLERLAKRAITSKNQNECFEKLLIEDHVNISCLLDRPTKSRLKNWKNSVTIVNDYVQLWWLAIATAPFTSFNERFDEIIMRLTETGFVEKWYDEESNDDVQKLLFKFGKIRESQHSSLLKCLFMIIFTGFTFGIVTFAIELLIDLRKRMTAPPVSEKYRCLKFTNNYMI